LYAAMTREATTKGAAARFRKVKSTFRADPLIRWGTAECHQQRGGD
jgi:hypothetical protein